MVRSDPFKHVLSIWDLDGCLVDNGLEIDKAPPGAGPLAGFLNPKARIQDPANVQAVTLALRHQQAGFDCHVVSGRPPVLQEASQTWLKAQHLWPSVQLRPPGVPWNRHLQWKVRYIVQLIRTKLRNDAASTLFVYVHDDSQRFLDILAAKVKPLGQQHQRVFVYGMQLCKTTTSLTYSVLL